MSFFSLREDLDEKKNCVVDYSSCISFFPLFSLFIFAPVFSPENIF